MAPHGDACGRASGLSIIASALSSVVKLVLLAKTAQEEIGTINRLFMRLQPERRRFTNRDGVPED
jgi:hypothetical protein